MVREGSLITVGQVKVFWQTAHGAAVFNSSVGGRSQKSQLKLIRVLLQACQLLVTVCQTFAMLSLVKIVKIVKICHFLWSSMRDMLQC